MSTEDLCFMLDALGLASGIDLPALLEVRQRLTQWLPGVALHGAVARAGLPTGWRPASSLHRVATS